MLNRIKNIVRSSYLSLIVTCLCVSFVAVPLTGCPGQSTFAALTETLGTASASLAALEGNTQLSSQLTTDTAAAVAAINNWKSGSVTTEVVEALNLVEADLSLFPVVSTYAPLIDLAIGTIDSILSQIPTPPASTKVMARNVRHIHLPKAPKNKSEFKSTWNNIALSNPATATAVIK